MSIFGSQFYHNTLRRYVATFGTMFNEMTISRYSKTGQVVQVIQVPISYASKEKWLARLTADPKLERPIAAQLPGMSFELTGMSYDGTRRLSPMTFHVGENQNKNRVSYVATPVPWNLDFALYIYVKNMDDGLQLVEQILPFFSPEWTNSIHLVPSLGVKKDVPTVLTGVTYDDTYEGSFEDRRALVWTLTFQMKAYFFGPERTSGIIKRATTNLGAVVSPGIAFDEDFLIFDTNEITDEEIDSTSVSSRVTITPGLTANGTPTSLASQSIPVPQISANSNYGYVTNTQFFTV